MKSFKRITAVIEARMTSKRLPGKVLKPILGEPALARLVERLKRSTYIHQIVVATTVNDTDQPIVDTCRRLGIDFFRGSEEDVLGRVVAAARSVEADLIVEVTGDCPLMDPFIVDQAIDLYLAKECDYVSNILERSFPRGIVVQVFSRSLIEEVEKLTQDPEDREHVTLYIYTHPERYQLANLKAPADQTRPLLALTLDTPEDYELISKIYENLYPQKKDFSLRDIFLLLDEQPRLAEINQHVVRKTPKKLTFPK